MAYQFWFKHYSTTFGSVWHMVMSSAVWWMNLECKHVLRRTESFSLNLPAALQLAVFCSLEKTKRASKNTLTQVASNSINIQPSINHHQLSALQANVPVLSDFICKCPNNSGNLPDDVYAVIKCIVAKVEATFTL